MNGVKYFEPNDDTHPAFGDALRQAKANGVNVMAIQCQVTDIDVMADKFVEVRL